MLAMPPECFATDVLSFEFQKQHHAEMNACCVASSLACRDRGEGALAWVKFEAAKYKEERERLTGLPAAQEMGEEIMASEMGRLESPTRDSEEVIGANLDADPESTAPRELHREPEN